MTIDPYKNRQLFIDGGAISEMRGIAKTLNQPVKYAGNPILRPSMPWERDAGFVGTVVRDDDGSFRAWYQGWYQDRYPACYATSMDGIFWHKPELGLIDVAGSTANNRIMEEACVPNVIHDPRDPDPDRRYKMLYWDFSIPRPARAASASVAFSPDGIRWTPFEGNPVLTGTGDTHSLLGWDENVGKYVAYVRPGRGSCPGPVQAAHRSIRQRRLHQLERAGGSPRTGPGRAGPGVLQHAGLQVRRPVPGAALGILHIRGGATVQEGRHDGRAARSQPRRH